jgi:N-methylhydantoinase B
VRQGRLSVDFAGSGPEARGAMNVPESALRAAVYFSVKTLVDPMLPPNSGFFDAVEIRAPAGTIVGPRYPAAVGARSLTCNKIVRAVFGAFAPLLPPDRAMAASHDGVPAIVFSGQQPARTGDYVYLETMGGGIGANATQDGMDAVHVHMTNTSNLPIEALEHEYTLIVDEYALVEDSGGAGAYRGGLGMARQIQATRDGIIFSVRSDGHLLPAPGHGGGKPGRCARLVRNYGKNDEEVLPSKVSHIAMKAGDSMRLETAGGGGFGKPEMRAPELLAKDLVEEKTTERAAKRDYGVALLDRARKAIRN